MNVFKMKTFWMENKARWVQVKFDNLECSNAKISVNHGMVSPEIVEKTLRSRKTPEEVLVVILKISGIKELCVTGVSRFFVEIFMSRSTKKVREHLCVFEKLWY